MNKIILALFMPSIIQSMNFKEEYYQHRNSGLQIYPDVTTQLKFEKLKRKTNDINLKNLLSILSFTHSLQSLHHKKLYDFTILLEKEYLIHQTAHHFTDVTLARIFLEKKYLHLHIRTNRLGLSNVFTNMQRVEDFTFNLHLLQNNHKEYSTLIENLYTIQKKLNSRHAELNFAIAVSLANPKIREKIQLK